MSQKNIFLLSEGDNWFFRNEKYTFSKSPEIKFLINYLKQIPIQKLLEIGCSSGKNTKILTKKFHSQGFGIDPSKLAIKKASTSRGGGRSFLELLENFSVYNNLTLILALVINLHLVQSFSILYILVFAYSWSTGI